MSTTLIASDDLLSLVLQCRLDNVDKCPRNWSRSQHEDWLRSQHEDWLRGATWVLRTPEGQWHDYVPHDYALQMAWALLERACVVTAEHKALRDSLQDSLRDYAAEGGR